MEYWKKNKNVRFSIKTELKHNIDNLYSFSFSKDWNRNGKFSVVDKTSIFCGGRGGIKEFAKSLGFATSTLKTILSQRNAVETKSDTLVIAAKIIKNLKLLCEAEIEKNI